VPSSVASSLSTAGADRALLDGVLPTGGSVPVPTTASWYTALPADLQTYLASVASVESGIVLADSGEAGAASRATAAWRGVGVGFAVGAAAVLA